MSFHLTVRRRYPGAVRQREYVSLATSALQQAGFRAENTLVAVSHCRDELTSSVRADIETSWGPAFELSGLAGLISAGTTGMSAALSHLPDLGEQAGFVVFAFAHVGIDDGGRIGSLRRPGMDRPTATCGSLAGVLKDRSRASAARSGADRLDSFDLEQSNVNRRVGELLAAGGETAAPDLADLADLALRCIEADVDTIFDRLVGRRAGRPLGVDGGLFTGVQIHGPDDQTYVWPSVASIDVGGSVTEALPETIRAAAAEDRREAVPRNDGSPEPVRPRPGHTDHGRYQPQHRDLSRHEHQHTEHEHFDPDRNHVDHGHVDFDRWDPGADRRSRAERTSPPGSLDEDGLLRRLRNRDGWATGRRKRKGE